MSTDDELPDLDEHWEEEESDDESSDDPTPQVTEKVKPAENSKDARRRLESLLEQQRVQREIFDEF